MKLFAFSSEIFAALVEDSKMALFVMLVPPATVVAGIFILTLIFVDLLLLPYACASSFYDWLEGREE